MVSMLCEQFRIKVLKFANLLPQYGLVWMAGGTVIARDSETGFIVVTPSGLPYKNLHPEDMIVTDLDCHIIEGKYRPSVATNLWSAILKKRTDLNAVIHTHSPYATAFALTNQPIPVITETMADWFGKPVPVSPYKHLEDNDFVQAPLDVLGDGYAVLMGQHGVITVGDSLESALERAVTLEEAARTYSIAKTIGTPMIFTPQMASRSFEYYHHRYGQQKPFHESLG
jgi:L-ribulose-5-phosphate 4-epimerase